MLIKHVVAGLVYLLGKDDVIRNTLVTASVLPQVVVNVQLQLFNSFLKIKPFDAMTLLKVSSYFKLRACFDAHDLR